MSDSYTIDSILNGISNIGTQKDRGANNSFYTRFIDDDQASSIYRSSWIGARVVDIPVFESLRAWREFTMPDDAGISDALYLAEDKYKVKDVFSKALTYAKIFGGAAVLMNIENSGDISEPLTIDKIKKNSLKWLTPIDKRRIYPLVTPDVYYPNSRNFLTPEYYTTTLNPESRASGEYKIHRSRMLIFNGIDLPLDEMINNKFWGDSVYTRLFDAISNADITQQAVSSLIHNSTIDIWKIRDLQGNLRIKDGESVLATRIGINNRLASIVNSIVIDKDFEELERKNLNLSGLDKILNDYLHICSAASGIPATKLLGSSSDGLQATGAGDIRNFYDMISSYQNEVIMPKLQLLDQVMAISELGYLPDDLSFKFNPMWQMSEKEQAEIENFRAQRDSIYLSSGVVSPENVAKELINNETYQSLTVEDAESLGDFGVSEYINSEEFLGLDKTTNNS